MVSVGDTILQPEHTYFENSQILWAKTKLFSVLDLDTESVAVHEPRDQDRRPSPAAFPNKEQSTLASKLRVRPVPGALSERDGHQLH